MQLTHYCKEVSLIFLLHCAFIMLQCEQQIHTFIRQDDSWLGVSC